jgi:soluble lytic murein transglycosylase-like protein
MVQLILSIAKVVGVPGSLLLAICTTESKLNNIIVFNDGNSPSVGVCQVKTNTARMFGFKGKTKELMRPRTNIKYAAQYLRYQLDRYNDDWCKATAAFNSGTYNPSQIAIGKPRNLRYVRRVASFLTRDERALISCNQKVAENP